MLAVQNGKSQNTNGETAVPCSETHNWENPFIREMGKEIPEGTARY